MPKYPSQKILQKLEPMYISLNKIGICNSTCHGVTGLFKVNLPRSGDEEKIAKKYLILKLEIQGSNFAS